MCLQPGDEYGSPSLDEIALFSRHFSEEYHRAIGEAAEEVAVEVSSPVSLLLQMPSLQACSLILYTCYIPPLHMNGMQVNHLCLPMSVTYDSICCSW